MKLNLLLYALLVGSILSGCRKVVQVGRQSEDGLIAAAQTFFSESLSTQTDSYHLGFQKVPRTALDKVPNWSKASVVTFKNKPAVIVPIHYSTQALIRSNFGNSNFYKLEDLSKLLIYWDEKGKAYGESLTYFPDGERQTSFVGILSVENWAGQPIAKYRFEKSGHISVYKGGPEEVISSRAFNQNKPEEKISSNSDFITLCFEASGVNYSPVTGETYYWTEFLGCSNYYFPSYDEDKAPPLPDPGDYGDGDPGGSGYGGYADDPLPVDLISTFGPADPVNISQELGCFDLNPQANFYVTVNVNQPFPGTRTKLNPFAERKVGHVYLSLTQLNPDNSLINRNVGFYPLDFAKIGHPQDYAIFGNDSNTPLTVALTIEVSAAEFQTVKQSLINAGDDLYDLNDYNCVDVVVNALEEINVHLPQTVGTIHAPVTVPGGPDILFRGLNPADLGEDIRNLNEADFRNQNGGRFTYIERYAGNTIKRTRDGFCP